jgi:hypothetical protein
MRRQRSTPSSTRQCTRNTAIPSDLWPRLIILFKVPCSLRNQAQTHSLRTRAISNHGWIRCSRPRFATHRQRGSLLGSTFGNSVRIQMEAKLASVISSHSDSGPTPRSPSALFHTNATNRQSHAFDSSSSFLSPDAANTVGNVSDAAATLAQWRVKLKDANNPTHRISALTLTTSVAERGIWAGVGSFSQLTIRYILINTRSFRPQSIDFSGLSGGPAFRSSRPDAGAALDGLSSAMGDSWASMVNTPLLPMFQSSALTAINNATAHGGQTVDLAFAKLNDLYGGGTCPAPRRTRDVSPVFQGAPAASIMA